MTRRASRDASGEADTLLVADRMASLGALVTGVAHEINNPVTYVLTNLEEMGTLASAMREALLNYRIRVSELLGEDAAGLIAEIELKVHQAGGFEVLDELHSDALEGAIRIRDIVRDLLSVSRNVEDSTPFDIHEMLDSSLRLVSKTLARHARLDWDYRATHPVSGDRARLAQVFMNLITNAMHACDPPDPERHRIRVSTRDLPAGDEMSIEIEISDSGGGIPEEARARVFEPFFTTKSSGNGTGLGLYISKRIIEDHGGSIAFRCNEGGTVFQVRLPGPDQTGAHEREG